MKKEGWEKILSDYIQEQSRTPFSWGTYDCVTFVSGYCQLVTGKCTNETVSGKYSSKETALALYESLGQSPIDIMDGFFNRVQPSFAQRGDVAFKWRDDGFSFGIIDGGYAVFKVDGTGLLREKIRTMDVVWRVE